MGKVQCDELISSLESESLRFTNYASQFLVSIIIVNRNGLNYLKTLIPAIIKHTNNIKYEIIVVDNASSDDSVSYLRKAIKNVPLRIIKNEVNESFSVANNKAAKLAKGKYIVLLNNDIEPLSGWLNYLLEKIESDHTIGSVGARLIYPYREAPRSFNPFKKQIHHSCKIQHSGIAFNFEGKQFRPFNLGKGKPINDQDVSNSGYRSALTAACLVVPKRVFFEVGGLDEKYIYGFEDVDFGLKLLQAGYKNYYCAESILFHHEFGTQGKEEKAEGAKRRQKNLIYFQRKWYLHIKKKYWSEKIYGNSNLYAHQKLMIACIDVKENEHKEFVSRFKHFDWETKFITKKQIKKLRIGADYDFIFQQNKNNNFELINNQLSMEVERAQCIDRFRDRLIKHFLAPSIVIKIAAKSWKAINSWGDYHLANILKLELEKMGHEVLLQIYPDWDNDQGMEYDVVIVFRGLRRYETKPHQINLLWNISHPDQVSLKEYEDYDMVFIASELWANKISKVVSVPIVEMLQCTDLERFKEPSDIEKKTYKQQLLFVGNSRGVFRKILKDLLPTNYELAVYGRNWKKILPKSVIRGDNIPNDSLYKYYGSADILLNDHWEDMRTKGFISNRIFDGLACGAFIVSDSVKNAGEISKYIQFYKDKEELKYKINYYLENEKERLVLSDQAIEYIRMNHTVRHRAKKFSEYIKILLKNRIEMSL